MNALFSELSQPFAPEDMSWKPGASKDNKCLALAYADLRTYQDRLDEVCGTEWACRYVPWVGNRIICELTIQGVTRSATGESDAQDDKNNMAGSVSEAMSFKRACAAFGLGRYIYNLPSQWVEFDPQTKKITPAALAKLEASYKAWYAANAKPAVEVKPTPVVAPVAPRETPTTKAGKAQTPQQQLWGAGEAVFGKEDWENGARRWLIMNWTEFVAKSQPRDSASDLTDAERVQLAGYMTANASGLQKKWATYQAAEAQASRGAKAVAR